MNLIDVILLKLLIKIFQNMESNNYLTELDNICKLKVHSKCLSKKNYKSHLECHNYYNGGTKTNKELAINERSYYFSFNITQNECVIYQTECMSPHCEWIKSIGNTTEAACKKAIKEFYKRYNK